MIRNYVELAGVDVADRDDQPSGFRTKFRARVASRHRLRRRAAIFEEHKIVPALDPFVAQDGFAFSRGDNTFSFGPVIAEMVPEASGHRGEEDDAAAAPASLAARSGGVSAKVQNLQLVKGAVLGGLHAHPEGGWRRDGRDVPDGGASLASGRSSTRAQTSRRISRRRHRYFRRDVRGERRGRAIPRRKQFTCDITGEGTLPHVSIETPAELNEEGAPVIRFSAR